MIQKILWLMLFGPAMYASHIIGGNFEITQTGRNDFVIDLTVFRDCGSPGSNPVQLQKIITFYIFDKVTGTTVMEVDASKTDSSYIDLGDNCYTPTGLCVQEIHLILATTIPDNANGYIIGAQVCCRNSVISNITIPGSTGITWTAEIPNPGIMRTNSSPKLGEYPPSGYLCLNYLRKLDLSATDPDADSLSYELVAPYNDRPNNPPFADVQFLSPYTPWAPIAGSPPLNIDSRTGILSCRPQQPGIYVFAYEVSEYRDGFKIGSIRRDLQLEVLNCIIDEPPVFQQPVITDFELQAGDQFCVNVLVTDTNITDSIILTSTVTGFVNSEFFTPPQPLKTTGQGRVAGRLCWQPSCEDAGANQELTINLKAISKGCNGEAQASRALTFKVPYPLDPVDALVPNIFSPNGDGINDIYTLIQPLPSFCAKTLSMKIYNRWGTKVYEGTLDELMWDGTFNGQPVAEGVYFYTLHGRYGETELDHKHFITVVR